MAKPHFDRPPDLQIDSGRAYEAKLETSHGAITVDLYPADAPNTVNSFIFLARQGFFDGLAFHRVIRGFVIQGGDPAGNGTGGPGYQFADELDNGLSYEVGTLAMANAGPNTNGSQFFIVTGPQGAGLPKNYTIFGKVREGLDAVHAIEAVPTGSNDRPRDSVVIERVSIVES